MDVRLGPYALEEEVGSGGMGAVYRARVQEKVALREGPLEADTVVALKILHPHLMDSPGVLTRLMREASLGQRIRHPNVVRVFDWNAFVLDGERLHYIVMEFVEGRSLHEILEQDGAVPEPLCRKVALAIARGLAAIHEVGAVHRDVKPENVIVTEKKRIKVMDLGMAGLREGALSCAHTGSFVGSFRYTAPEQLRSAHDVDGRADLFALGIVLYELASGTHPHEHGSADVFVQRLLFEAPPPLRDLNPRISPDFADVVHALMEKDLEERLGSAAELARLLAEQERGEVADPPASRRQPCGRKASRSPET